MVFTNEMNWFDFLFRLVGSTKVRFGYLWDLKSGNTVQTAVFLSTTKTKSQYIYGCCEYCYIRA